MRPLVEGAFAKGVTDADAEAGMAAMGTVLKEQGGEIYLPAAE